MPTTFSAIPMPIKKHLVTGKWYLRRLPHLFQYPMALLQKPEIDKQLQFLPMPGKPSIRWIEMDRIQLQVSLKDHHPAGRLCIDGDWDINKVHELPSIFQSIPQGQKKWALHETIRSIFILGKPYNTTPQYQSMLRAVEQKRPNPPQVCRTVKEIDKYFCRLLAAFKSMQKNGYLTQN